jgi:hypothetical protein
MVDLTLLELHLDDSSIKANAPFSGGDDTEAETETASATDEEPAPDDGGSRLRLLAPVAVGLVALAAIGVAVRRLIGGAPDPVEELEITDGDVQDEETPEQLD